MRRYSEPVKADVRRRMSSHAAESGSDFSAAGHPCRHHPQLEECLVVPGSGSAGIREGTRGLA